ncbi:MAG: HlyD family efflux transporter periplasmic adaptor subunit [Pseudomonadota bacterium]
MSRHHKTASQASENERNLWQADKQIGRYLLLACCATIILLFGAGGWAATTNINGAVIAPGEIKVQSFSKSVQHLEGGLIKEILVKNGDQVAAGDVLIRLDRTELENQIRGEQRLAASKSNQIELLNAELADLGKLKEKGLVQKPRLSALARQIESLNGEKDQHLSNSRRFGSRLARLDIRAPIDGVIHGLAFHTLQGVVAPGEEVLKIVPQTENLVVEAKVSPNDIDQVALNQMGIVRLSSFNQSTTPETPARVIHVSADLSRDEARDYSYYLVNLELQDLQSGTMRSVKLLPGMPTEVFISTQKRTVLSYLVKPISDQFQRAFRE